MFNFFQNAQIQNNIPKYSVSDFTFRLKKLEKLCIKENLDGFLLINGPDSRENTEYLKLTNWLLLGYSGLEIEENEYLNSIYNEIIILIKKGSVHIYLEPECQEQLQNFIYSIPNVDILCPNQEQYEDKDELELLKVTYFFKIMKDVKRVGILLGKKDKGKLQGIEKWPLVQSYGLQGVGFFSLNHEIIDLAQRINQIYKNFDKFYVSKLIFDVSQRLTGHFIAATGQLGDTKIHKRQLITEAFLGEIFKSTQEIEEFSKCIQNRQKEEYPLPKSGFLFGKNTNDKLKNDENQKLNEIKYNENSSSFHFIIENYDLRTNLRACRTYFLKKNVQSEKNLIIISNDEDVHIDYQIENCENVNFKDEEYIINLYLGLVVGFNEVMQYITKDYKNLTEEYVHNYIENKINRVFNGFNTSEKQNTLQVNITLKAFNAFGENVPIDIKDTITFKLTPYFFLLRISLSNIQSLIYQNVNLGSIVFGESFILQEGCYLILTKNIPYFDFWNTSNEYSIKIEKMKKRVILDQLDEFNKNRIFINSGKLSNYGFDIPIIESAYVLHEKGLRINSEKIGWFIIFFNKMQQLKITQNTQNTWLIFNMDQNICLNALNKHQIALEFTGNALQEVFFKIKNYFDNSNIKYEYITDIPAIFQESNLAQREILKENKKQLIQMNSIQNEKFLIEYLDSKQLMILNNMKDLKLVTFKNMYEQLQSQPKNFEKIGVIVINGPYCSGKRKFCENLSRFGGETCIRIHTFKLEINEFNEEINEKFFLTNFLRFSSEKKIQKSDIILMCIPYFLSTKILLEYFTKSEKIENNFYIRNVISKINLNNFYQNSNKNLIPNLISYCIEGYTQYIMLDTYNNYDDDVNKANKLIKNIVPNASIFKIMNNILNPGLAKDLIYSNNFMTEGNILSRYKNQVYLDCLFDRKVIFVPFKLPLIREKMRDLFFIKIMKEQEQVLADFIKIQKIEKVEIQNVISDKNATKIDFIQGIVRYEGKLQDGIEEITINSNYFIERTMKGIKCENIIEKINNKEYKNIKYNGLKSDQNFGFLFGGKNLNKQLIYDLLKKVCKEPQQIEFRTEKDLTKEEIKQIQFENRGQLLEFGQFYDGQFWRNDQGMILEEHPQKQVLIQKFLDQEKEERIKFNTLQLQEWNEWRSVYDKILF
ncbi:hypothetical protein IMG5_149240 [Ichthyophthirius multifiliis]|uniref:DAAF9 N-terminal domain-containing protein n=1 Tax=Ichthyophthirius multifiliis TaxID=5932 RepID=G0QYF5_ICHMU|nr:hypothetical protein IMG5_149240 [Ichthyophthirius multifiliis]EGR29741.1 hypothetical protein IMG5_149240 [Ichthyophthirius multifiliis]|eukprot:XP_004030977.1 hypothetical protein IMG5_149240 [Ichthyophthirius multifiliis]